MIFGGLKVVLFKKETIVSNFFFKLLDCEKFLHNCNRQNIHVAETTCTPASAIFTITNRAIVENSILFDARLLTCHWRNS